MFSHEVSADLFGAVRNSARTLSEFIVKVTSTIDADMKAAYPDSVGYSPGSALFDDFVTDAFKQAGVAGAFWAIEKAPAVLASMGGFFDGVGTMIDLGKLDLSLSKYFASVATGATTAVTLLRANGCLQETLGTQSESSAPTRRSTRLLAM